MKYKFEDSFLELGFIKELLKEFNLPNIPVATDYTPMYENQLYVKDLGIYRYNGEKLIKIADYYYNRPILNLTRNMSITTSYYGSDIHEYLGEYLRFIRDYKQINLMSLYNCFSNRSILSQEPYTTSEGELSYKHADDKYNYYAVPVKFGQSYTIGIDSTTPIEMYCVLWNSVLIKGEVLGTETSFKRNLIDLYNATHTVIHNCSYRQPIIYNNVKDFDAKPFVNHLNDLRLILKVPQSNKSSISVLEGDYIFNSSLDGTITTTGFYGDNDLPDDGPDKKMFKNYPTRLSLLDVNDEQKHPFADRLLEYLYDTAVSNLDALDDNIKGVQEYLKYLKAATPKILYGEWDQHMNDTIYSIANNSYINKYNDEKKVRYITNKTNTLRVKGDTTSEGIYFKDLVDIKNDLLMYMDKDVESLFLATDVNDYYTR